MTCPPAGSRGRGSSEAPGLLVISSCTSRKAQPIGRTAITAADLYLGQQHVRLMGGVRAYQEASETQGALRVAIVSALHGLLDLSDLLEPYDFSFSGMGANAINFHAESVGIPRDVAALLATPFRLGMLLLSEAYVHSCRLTASTSLGGPVLAFCSPAVARRLPAHPNLRPIVLANQEARRFSCGLTSLKGDLAARILCALSDETIQLEELADPSTDILERVEGATHLRRLASAA